MGVGPGAVETRSPAFAGLAPGLVAPSLAPPDSVGEGRKVQNLRTDRGWIRPLVGIILGGP